MKSQVVRTRLFFAVFLCLTSLVGTAGAVERNDSQRTRQFVVMGYQGITLDLERGGGPYLSTLAELLGIPEGKRGRMAAEVKRLATAHPNIMDFSDQVVALQQSTPTEIVAASP